MAERTPTSPARDTWADTDRTPPVAGRPRDGQGGRVVDRMRERASEQLNTQKNRASEQLGSVAQAVRQSTHQLRTDHHDQTAHAIEVAADQLEQLASRLREKDLREFYADARQFARQQPALFLGASFAAGLAVARFLKSEPQHVEGGREGAYG